MPTDRNPTTATPHPWSERVERANRLFREFHTRCFWHSPRDLVITEDLISFVVKGLRMHGGRRGFLLAEALQPNQADDQVAEREPRECR